MQTIPHYRVSTPLKIKIEKDGVTFTAELHWDSDVRETLDAFSALLIGHGFMPNSINDVIVDMAEEIIESDDRTTDTE